MEESLDMGVLIVRQIKVGPMMNFSYLVADRKSAKGVIIDPCWEGDKLIAASQRDGIDLVAILATHAHFDHVNAAQSICSHPKLPLCVHRSEAKDIPKEIDLKFIEDEDVILIGGYELKCIHTPGHSSGSLSFLVDGNLFTGDTLFVGGCGRVDLPGGSEKKMKESLKKLSKLPDDTKVYPGHDYGDRSVSTIGYEKRHNPYMKEQDA